MTVALQHGSHAQTPTEGSHGSSANVQAIALERIHPSPRNPRNRLENVDELAESIRAYGLLQPVVVRRVGDGFEVVAGHRRLAAVQSLEWHEIPAIVREADDEHAYLLTLIENLQRDDLTPREESRALEVLVREQRWSTRQVALAVKRSQAYVSKRLRVFEDNVLAPLVLNNQLAVSVAEELLPLRPAQRKALAQRAVDETWDGAAARAAVRKTRPASQRRSSGLLQQLRALRTTL